MHARRVAPICTLIVSTLLPAFVAQAATLTTLYSFQGGSDGANPSDLLSEGGFLYGTTSSGGTFGAGTIFKVDLAAGLETNLYSFAGGLDGLPNAGLTYIDGILFGTTYAGGTWDKGTVFGLDTRSGRKVILHSFGNGSDGASPGGGLILWHGALYGTTTGGGNVSGPFGPPAGTVFKIDLRSRTESVLYNFRGFADDFPDDRLIRVGDVLFGTAWGSLGDGGEVFKFDPASGAETTLLAFVGPTDPPGLPYDPDSDLVKGGGRLYGTTLYTSEGGPAIFEVDPVTGAGRTVHNFSLEMLHGDPVIAADPLLYRDDALFGGAYDSRSGSIIQISPTSGQVTEVYRFSGGVYPGGRLIYDAGAIYGITGTGGTSGQGTVFKLVP